MFKKIHRWLQTCNWWPGVKQRRIACKKLAEEAQQQLNLAAQIGKRLLELKRRERNGELQLLRMRNPTLAALVESYLKEVRKIARLRQKDIQATVIEAMLRGMEGHSVGTILDVDGKPTFTPVADEHNRGCGIAVMLAPNESIENIEIELGTGYLVPDNSKIVRWATGEDRKSTRTCHL